MEGDDKADEGEEIEFPPGLDALSDEIERAAEQPRESGIREQLERMAERVAPFVRDARLLAEQVQADGEARAAQMREAFAVLKQQVPAMLSAVGSVELGRNVYGSVHMTATSSIVATAHVFSSDSGHGEDTARVERAGAQLSPLDRLRAGYLFYIVLVWLLCVGAGVVGDMVNLSPHIQNQIQDDAQAVSLAFDLTIVFLSMRKH